MHNFYKKPFPNYNLKKSSDDKNCIFRFSSCDENKYPFHKLKREEIKKFVKFIKKVEKMNWGTIKTYSGLHYETISSLTPPDYLSKDITLKSMRVDKCFRVIGYKENEFFFIVWIDPNHEVYKG